MDMFASLRSKNEETLMLVLDIGSSSVAGALVRLRSKEHPHIIYSVRKDAAFFDQKGADHLLAKVKEALDKVVADLLSSGLPLVSKHEKEKKIKRQIHTAFCFYSSHWYLSQSSMIEYSAKEPTLVTQTLIDSLIKEHTDDFEASSLAQNTIGEGQVVDVLEQKIMDVHLNGYVVQEPLNKNAKSMQVNLFTSLIPHSIKETVEKSLRASFFLEHVHHHSFALTIYSVMASLKPEYKDYLFVDVGGAVTDVLVVKNGRIRSSASFPFGKTRFLKDFAAQLKLSPEETLSRLALFERNMLNKKNFEQVDASFKNLKQQWNNELCTTIEKVRHGAVPHLFFFMADDDVSSFFSDFMGEGDAVNYVACQADFEVRKIHKQFFKNSYAPSRVSSDDVFLIPGVLYSSFEDK